MRGSLCARMSCIRSQCLDSDDKYLFNGVKTNSNDEPLSSVHRRGQRCPPELLFSTHRKPNQRRRGSHMTIELHAIECLLTIIVYRAGICMIKLFIRQSSESALTMISEHEISFMGFDATHRIIAMFICGAWHPES
jgi:hypothetical protein